MAESLFVAYGFDVAGGGRERERETEAERERDLNPGPQRIRQPDRVDLE